MTPQTTNNLAEAPDCQKAYDNYEQQQDQHPPTPETCSECDGCQFSWHDSHWHCDDGTDGIGMVLDNDIHLTVHQNCPLIRRDD